MKTNVTNTNIEPATKQDIERLDNDIESLADVMNERFEVVEGKLKNLNDKILTMQDKILKKLDDLETDNSVGTEQYRRVHITLDSHEKRIKSLENAKN